MNQFPNASGGGGGGGGGSGGGFPNQNNPPPGLMPHPPGFPHPFPPGGGMMGLPMGMGPPMGMFPPPMGMGRAMPPHMQPMGMGGPPLPSMTSPHSNNGGGLPAGLNLPPLPRSTTMGFSMANRYSWVSQVFVGKIHVDIEDDYMKKLLEQCGRIIAWRRSTDPVSGQLKAFGMCDYAHPIAALVALKVLDKFELMGQQLLLKVDKKTRSMLDEVETAVLSANPKLIEEEGDSALAKVKELVNAGVTTNVSNIASIKLAEENADNESRRTERVILTADEKVSLVSQEVSRFRELQKKDEVKRISEHERQQQLRKKKLEDDIRHLVKTRERERDRERSRLRRLEDDYPHREKQWERREQERGRDKENREKRLQDRGKERLQLIEKQNSVDESEWKLLMRERARVRDRDREKEADKEDVIREQKEVEEEIQRQQAAEAERQRAEAEANGAFASPRVVGLKLDRKKRSRVDVAAAFDDTEDTTAEDLAASQKKRRVLKKLEVTAEDAKSLIQKIPTETDALFAYEVDWEQFEKASVLENKLRQWVTKKIVEYLGEEEPTLRDFILTKIGERSKPQAIIEQLKVVLEDETELFVTKLWRALIYHTLESEYML